MLRAEAATHALPLPGGGWDVWRELLLRSAGFPVDGLVALGDQAYAAAVDRLGPGEAPEEAVERTAERRQAALLRRVAADPAFREAVAWQNRAGLHNVLDPLLAADPDGPRNKQLRRRERMVARYWQRYCAKNDTIGFFGPTCWARVAAAGPALEARPGPRLVDRREVLFEGWCLDALAEVLARDPQLRPWVAPRRHPLLHLDGRVAYRPREPPLELGAGDAAVLARCDGERPARELAAEVLALPGSTLRREQDVYRVLDNLVARDLARWDLALPVEAHPERTLRGLLGRVGDPAARDRALGALDLLEAGRERAAAAASAEELDAAAGALDRAFTALTERAPTRRPGESYAGRQLLFLEARRDLQLVVGPELLRALGPPLTLLLHGGRWLLGAVADAYLAALGELHAELAGGGQVDLAELWFWAQSPLFVEGSRPVDPLLAEFGRRWAALLRLDGGRSRVQLRAEALAPLVAAAFGEPRPAWPQARHASADVQLAAAGADAVRRGDYQLVLGELHAAWNGVSYFFMHPDPAALARAVRADFPEPRVVPLLPKDWPRHTALTADAVTLDDDWQLCFSDVPGGRPGRRLPLAGLLVERDGRRLRVRGRDGGPRLDLDLLTLLGPFLSTIVVDAFKRLGDGPHTPRATVDRLVVCRESWRLPPAELRFAAERGEHACFRAARRFAREAGLPRFAFAKVPSELKPIYVDFDSPVLVGGLAAAVRASARAAGERPVVFTEMLPAPGQAWLPDADGRRYVSELRLQLVEQLPDRAES
jgi:Lantibiotic dehydratase, N terminus